MSTTIPSPATTPSLIADYFEAAATHADNNKKVSYSDIKTLLKKVTNSSEKLTPENYQRVQTATGKLNSILENQKSNVTEKKHSKSTRFFVKHSIKSLIFISKKARSRPPKEQIHRRPLS